jgi:UTP--glucose-1-phosphate uridylyltransferase
MLLDDFESRFPDGPPSLRECTSLTVEGDVTFTAGTSVHGDVVVRAANGPATVSGRLEGEVEV